jgi:glycosyltransferase involved in cell wall biosynthesis
MPQPLISVVMPMFNARWYVAEAVESILSQTLGDFELLALDDGSTDDTADLVEQIAKRDSRVNVIRLSNRGGTATMNAGVERAAGEFIARFDADDVSLPQRFEKQIAFLRANQGFVAVGSAVLIIDAEGRPLRRAVWPTTHEASDHALMNGDNDGGLPHPAAMIRAAVMRQVGGYREKFSVSQDKDLWLRLGEIGQLANLPEVLVHYRTHGTATGATKAAAQRDAYVIAIRDAAARRGIAMPEKESAAPVYANWLSYSDPSARWAMDAISGCYFASARHHAMRHWASHPLSPRAWQLVALAFAAPVFQTLLGKKR